MIDNTTSLAVFLYALHNMEGSGGSDPAVYGIIADDYDATSTYSKGDYAIYNKKLYRAAVDISTPEEFTAAHWTEVTVTDELGAGVYELIADEYNAASTYAKGDYVIYNRELYRAAEDISTPEAFTAAHWTKITVSTELCPGVYDLIAEAYDATSTYDAGDYVIHNREFYRAAEDILTPEAFTAAHWDKITVGTELHSIVDDLGLSVVDGHLCHTWEE